MYNLSYEEYMRSVLGYPLERELHYYNNYSRTSEDFDRLYPEIYHTVYPTICKTCDIYENREITDELLNEMTNQVMANIKIDEKFGIQAELKRDENKNEKENRQRRPNNFLFRDLIRILLLRELLRRKPSRPRPFPPPNFPMRPQPRIYEEFDF